MFLSAILLAVLIAYSNGVSYSSLIEKEWQVFKLEHDRFYKTVEEEEYRKSIFMKNKEIILEHNSLHEMGLSTYKMGMNQFGDITDDEYERYYMMPYNSPDDDLPQDNMQEGYPSYLYSDEPLPKKVDWREMGAVTEVKNQKTCGACYAFSATGALEAQHYLKTNKLVSLSEQNIVDCTYKKPSFRNTGCSGGRVDYTFTYIKMNNGIDTEKSYPYLAEYQEKCDFNRNFIGATVSNYVNLPPGNETALQIAIAKVGPVAVMVDNKNLRFYAGGIYDNPACSSDKYSHGVLAVGYGTYENLDYWLVKNSWGAKWGENGYIMMVRNKHNQCAIATAGLYPVVL